MVAAGGGADRLFNLRSDLFAGRVLDGAWELAIYLPEAGQIIPPVAMALDSSRVDEAERAMELFIRELRERWPVLSSPYPDRRRPGACLANLNVMPGLAPCYVATERGLVLGWNAASVEQAATPPATQPAPPDGRSFLRIDLERFPLADERLRAATGSAADLPPLSYPWRQLELVGARTGRGRFELEATLLAAETAR